MALWKLVAKEILHRKGRFVLGVLAVSVAVGSFTASRALLRAHDIGTREVLAAKQAETERKMAELEDDMRKATLKLGFNLVILPKGLAPASWHAEDYAAAYMPEEYVQKLAQSRLLTVRHILPTLKERVTWPERGRTIILIGTRGEVPDTLGGPRTPLVQPVARGTAVLGYHLHQDLGLAEGDNIALMGREFTVAGCRRELGTQDDITVWVSLAEAQELLGKQGLINAILALECVCTEGALPVVREEVGRVLPETQVIWQEPKGLARAEARAKAAASARATLEREAENRARLRQQAEAIAATLVPTVLLACMVWIGLLALGNVRERRSEIGILRAVGLRSKQILAVFLSKALIMGVLGGAVGALAGPMAGSRLAGALHLAPTHVAGVGDLLEIRASLGALMLAASLACLATWIPAMLAAGQDVADVLREG